VGSTAVELLKEDKANNKASVLYVDDDEGHLSSFKNAYKSVFEIRLAKSIEQARELLRFHEIHVLLIEYQVSGQSGISFLQELSVNNPRVIRMMLTECRDSDIIEESINVGRVFKYLCKTLSANQVKEAIFQGYETYLKEDHVRKRLTTLMEANVRLEFMLRQRLFD
jgi:response regulator RpfG family c-di-GMP phosphodiesterase